MAQLTKQALIVENNQSFPNNNTGAITPTILRNFNTDVIDSTVNQIAYNSASAQIENSIDALNAFTASFNPDVTGSSLITASANLATITFTKGNGSTFDVVVTATADSVAWDNVTGKPSGLVSGSSQVVSILNPLNTFSASQETKDSTLATYTGSVDTKFSTIGSQSGSWVNVPLTSLNAYTASQDTKNTTLGTYTGSVDSKFSTLASVTASLQQQLTNIGSQSGSWITESETGSFARTNITNTFSATQNITGDLNVTGTINANKLNVTIESSSVIYSSGSNVFGDAADDTQTLNGSVNVVNQLTASGLHYPTTDGTADQVMITDGAGNLSFTTNAVTAISEDVRYGESISVGDPLYVNGSSGNRPIVFKADAGNPAKMPVIYVASTAGGVNTNTKAITLGLITGVTTTGYPEGTDIYVAEGGGWSSSRPSGSASIVQTLGIVTKEGSGGSGRGLVLNPGPATLPNIQTGYAWVGNGSNQPIAVATSSFAGSTINTGSFATTASNTFYGDQTINGSNTLSVGGTITANSGINVLNGSGINLSANIEGSGSAYTSVTTAVDVVSDPTNVYSSFQLIKPGGEALIAMAANSYTAEYPGITIPYLFGGGNNPDGTNAGIAFPTNGQMDVWKKSNFKYGADVTGSLKISGGLTSSLQQGYAWVGGAGNTTITVPTSSFAGSTINTGSFATTGSNNFTGGQTILNGGGIDLKANLQGSGSAYINVTSTVDNTTDPTNVFSSFQLVDQTQTALIAIAANSYTAEYPGVTIPYLFGGGNNPGGTNAGIAFPTNGNMDVWKKSNFKYGVENTGSLNTSGSVSITGSLSVSGSINTSVIPLAISSNTASLNASTGNTFQLNLVSGSATRLQISGAKSGQTINLLVSQSATGPGTLVFGTGLVQPSGSFYSASQVASAEDILTLATFVNPNKIYVANIKNLI